MKTLPITAKELRDGKILTIETIDKDDFREAELSFNSKFNRFTIWFNGAIIHTCKGFKSLHTRMEKLNEKFPLEIN